MKLMYEMKLMNQYTNVVIIDILHNACPFPQFKVGGAAVWGRGVRGLDLFGHILTQQRFHWSFFLWINHNFHFNMLEEWDF